MYLYIGGLNIIIIITTAITRFCVFLSPSLADGFSLEFEWQQVSSNFQDSPRYSGQS